MAFSKAEKKKIEKAIRKMREAYNALDEMNDILDNHGFIKDHEHDPSQKLQLSLKAEFNYWENVTWWQDN